MKREMMAYCGTNCEECAWREQVNCKGCKANQGKMFWGECDKAKCCIANKFEHCGECAKMPCEILSALFADPEHGDQGSRLNNLKKWAENNR
ncbi:MAG: DUF3795 domain-containing protein [Clostridia bacterium]|nr:DUF3795 domain-containing protein [Clostridia bacterium]